MSLFLVAIKELGKYAYKRINDTDTVSKAIEATARDFNQTEVPVRDLLLKWYGSKELNGLIDHFNAGQREINEDDFTLLVNSFIETSDFYLGSPEITEQGARQILLAFERRLSEEMLKAKEGLVFLAARIERLSERIIDANRQDARELMGILSNGIPEVARISNMKKESLIAIGAEDDQARKILRAEEIVRYVREPERLKEARRLIDGLIPELIMGLEKGSPNAAVKTSVVEKLIDELIKEDEESIYLLQYRAQLRDRRGHWDKAASDLQELLNSSDTISAGVLTQAGMLLMTLGNWPQAIWFLDRGLEGALDPVERVRAQEALLWIHDYQGRHNFVEEQSSKLLNAARDVDPALEVAVEHRWGRATFESAKVANNNRELMEISLRRLLSARDRALRTAGFANPYHANWISRVSDALETRDRRTLWEEAKQFAEEFGGPVVAHIRLSEADRAIRKEDWFAAADFLIEAQRIWKEHPYPKGSFDVSYRLGQVYKELGTQYMADSLMNLRLATRIGVRLKLPKASAAKKQFNETAQDLPSPYQYLIKQADERLKEKSFSRLLRGWRLSVPDPKKLDYGGKTSAAGLQTHQAQQKAGRGATHGDVVKQPGA